MKDKRIPQLNSAIIAVAILISQFVRLSSHGEVNSGKTCSVANDSSKLEESVSIASRSVACVEFFDHTNCTGTPTILTGKPTAFPKVTEPFFRSFRECFQQEDYVTCPSSTLNEVNVTFSMLGVETQGTFKRGECEALRLTSILDFTLTFSPRDESHCIQFYSSPDCTTPFHRVTSQQPFIVYGFAPNVVQSVSLCNCSVENGNDNFPREQIRRNARELVNLDEEAFKDAEDEYDFSKVNDEVAVDLVEKTQGVPKVFFSPILQAVLFFAIIAMCFCFPRAFFPTREVNYELESDNGDWVVI